ncbi:hypothetical protein T03_14432, partial [Trichinella britovi]
MKIQPLKRQEIRKTATDDSFLCLKCNLTNTHHYRCISLMKICILEISLNTTLLCNRRAKTDRHLTPSATKKQTPLPEGLDDTNFPPGKKARSESSEETTTRVLLANTRGSARIRFQTVKAIATGANGKRLVINCLFDSGAEQTRVTEDTAKALGLVGMAESVTVKGIGSTHCTPTLGRRARFRLSLVKANDHDLDVEPIEALTLPQICDDIQLVPVRCDNWKHLQHLRIPEEQDEKLPVHVLIGVDSYGRFLGEKILQSNPTEPVAIETTLGWVVFGPVNPPSAHQYRFHCAQKEDNMECTLKKSWELESISIQQQEDKTTQDAESRERGAANELWCFQCDDRRRKPLKTALYRRIEDKRRHHKDK